MPLSIAELKARLAATKLGNRGTNFIRLEPDIPIIVHILPGNDSLWFRQIGSHWLGKKRVACTNPTQDEDGQCYICSMIEQQKALLAEVKREHENDTGDDALEANQVINATEDNLEKITVRRAFAFNVVIRNKNGLVEEVAKTIEAPWALFQGIYNYFNTALTDYEVDITDPKKSTPFTLSRTGSGKKKTRYSATAAPHSMPIYTGTGAEEKMAELLAKALDLDEQYKFPTQDELVTAWNSYTNANGEEERPAPLPAQKPSMPPSMSRVGAAPTTAKPIPATSIPVSKFNQQRQQRWEQENSEPDHIPGLGPEEDTEETAPNIPSKAEANAASMKLLGRLKKGNK